MTGDPGRVARPVHPAKLEAIASGCSRFRTDRRCPRAALVAVLVAVAAIAPVVVAVLVAVVVAAVVAVVVAALVAVIVGEQVVTRD